MTTVVLCYNKTSSVVHLRHDADPRTGSHASHLRWVLDKLQYILTSFGLRGTESYIEALQIGL